MNKREFMSRLMANVDTFAKKRYGREPSDYELARDMGFSRENFRNWIAANNWIGTEQLNKMATFLRCQPWELLHPDPLKLRRQIRAMKLFRDSDESDEK
jgi:hypothetical protein